MHRVFKNISLETLSRLLDSLDAHMARLVVVVPLIFSQAHVSSYTDATHCTVNREPLSRPVVAAAVVAFILRILVQ